MKPQEEESQGEIFREQNKTNLDKGRDGTIYALTINHGTSNRCEQLGRRRQRQDLKTQHTGRLQNNTGNKENQE